MSILSGMPSVNHMVKQIDRFANIIHAEYGFSKLYVWINYFHCALKFGCNGAEYMRYKFYLLNDKGRKQFLCHLQRNIFEASHTDEKLAMVINSKEGTLILFNDYISRDWVGIKSHNSDEEYEAFAAKHRKCIVKPDGAFGGHGIKIYNTSGGGIAA